MSERNYWSISELIHDWKYWRNKRALTPWEASAYRERARASWGKLWERFGYRYNPDLDADVVAMGQVENNPMYIPWERKARK